MVQDDIYGNKRLYENFCMNYKTILLEKHNPVEGRRGQLIYSCKNPKNVEYFGKLIPKFEAKDLSYIRRLRIFSCLKVICHVANKDLKDCDREDIDEIMAFAHTRLHSIESKKDFIRYIKLIWKILFPEHDEKGRIDDQLIPYPVRHLKSPGRSQEKRRQDKLEFEEFERIVDYFSADPRMQAYLMLAMESLGRPQEICFTRIRDYEFHDDIQYCKVDLSEHGKTGLGILQAIDSYPYLIKWFEVHPAKKDPQAFFFVNLGDKERSQQLKPANINKMIRKACKDLGIHKPVTAYSLKRNGVTYRRLRGDSDMEIQHAARWASNRQLKTYDLSHQEEALKIELIKRGKIKDVEKRYLKYLPTTKECPFCKKTTGFSEEVCPSCHRKLDQSLIKKELEFNSKMLEQIIELTKKMEKYEAVIEKIIILNPNMKTH